MRWWWWRGKLTKTAMEKLKPWEMEEISRRQELAHIKCREELDKKVDWEMMKKHLQHNPAALQAYEKLCNEARKSIDEEVTRLIWKRRPDVRLQCYYGKFAYLPFKERMFLEWTEWVNQLHKRYPLEMKLLQKWMPAFKKCGVFVGCLIAGAVVVGAGNWFGNVNEQKMEKKCITIDL